eukprot:scaffold25046_cov107-Skeletonema_dohrnii-CCMP3373.AAC.1
MIHEKQERQFCAIHAVNNLLQIPKDSDCVEIEGVGPSHESSHHQHVIHEWRCHGRLIYCQQRLRGNQSPAINGGQNNASGSSEKMNLSVVATQSEFNDIAEEITNRELRLMEGNDPMIADSNDCTTEKQSACTLSIYQKFRSKHFTPNFGNYSYEVLETALSRRGVTLEYYRVAEDASESIPDTIGFIVHEEETSADSLSYLRRLGSHVPIIRNICKGGRHWWTITGVKRSCYLSDSSNNKTCVRVKEQKEDSKKWYLIDSNLDHIQTLSSDDDLVSILRDMQSRGALIFCCHVAQQ